MASKAVMDAVRARLVANWTLCPVVYPNEVGTAPADTSEVLYLQFPVASEEQITVGAPGNNVFREEGAIRFVLEIPRGQGVDAWMPWIEELRALFRGRQFTPVTTWAPSPAILDDRNDDGKFWSLSFAVPYIANIFA